ncbi:MAG: hypothetical protein NE334_10380 [Lentisphaeraceae bacterium]|nr:hypothetical protein [Lentisphaeraceae bacterium]
MKLFLGIVFLCFVLNGQNDFSKSSNWIVSQQSKDGSWGDYNKDITTAIVISTLVHTKQSSASVNKGISYLEIALKRRKSLYMFGYGDAIMLEALFEISKYHKSKTFSDVREKLITRILKSIEVDGSMSEGFRSNVEPSLPIAYYCLKSVSLAKLPSTYDDNDKLKIKKAVNFLQNYKLTEGIYKFSKRKTTAYPVFSGRTLNSMIFELNSFYNITSFDEYMKFFHSPDTYYRGGPIALNRYVNSLLWRNNPDKDFAEKAFLTQIVKTQKADGSCDSFGSMELFEKFDKNLITTCYMLKSLNSLNRFKFKWYDHKYLKNKLK